MEASGLERGCDAFLFFTMFRTICLRRDIDLLFAQRQNLARAGRQTSVLSALYVTKDTPEQPVYPGIHILLIVPKRFVKHSNKRNTIKRWIKEALRLSPKLTIIEAGLQASGKQVLLGLRGDQPPSKTMNWDVISKDIEIILTQLSKNLKI